MVISLLACYFLTTKSPKCWSGSCSFWVNEIFTISWQEHTHFKIRTSHLNRIQLVTQNYAEATPAFTLWFLHPCILPFGDIVLHEVLKLGVYTCFGEWYPHPCRALLLGWCCSCAFIMPWTLYLASQPLDVTVCDMISGSVKWVLWLDTILFCVCKSGILLNGLIMQTGKANPYPD